MGVASAVLCFVFLASAARAAELAVVSLNLDRERDAARILRDLARAPGFAAADFFLLQEVVRPQAASAGVADDLAARLGYRVEFAPAFSPHPGLVEGLAILSRYPLSARQVTPLRHYDLRFRTRERIGLAVTAETPLGPLRLVDVHLDSRLNVWEREEQLRPLAEQASRFAGPVVFGGDFNTSNMRWIGRALPLPLVDNQRRTIRDLMARFGFTTPFPLGRPTHDLLGLQLDWIYVKGLEAGHTEIHPVRFSDHHAIRARVRLAQVEQASSLPRASARRASVLDHTSGRLPYPNHRRRQFPPIRDEQPVANP